MVSLKWARGTAMMMSLFLFINIIVIIVVSTEDVKQTVFCHVQITELNLRAFMYAIKNHYWYQVYVGE